MNQIPEPYDELLTQRIPSTCTIPWFTRWQVRGETSCDDPHQLCSPLPLSLVFLFSFSGTSSPDSIHLYSSDWSYSLACPSSIADRNKSTLYPVERRASYWNCLLFLSPHLNYGLCEDRTCGIFHFSLEHVACFLTQKDTGHTYSFSFEI